MPVTLLDMLKADGVDVIRKGRDLWACCPFHQEKTPSFHITPKDGDIGYTYHCFGCPEAGDDVVYAMKTKKLTMVEALDLVKGERRDETERQGPPKEKHKPPPKFMLELPPHDKRYNYRNAHGKIRFIVIRQNGRNGQSKRFVQAVRGKKAGKPGWYLTNPVTDKRPLYRLVELIAADKERQVMVVEGEKCADAVAKTFPKATVVSWCGGTNAWGKTDWSPLHGRNVLLVADRDEPGVKCMRVIGKALARAGSKCRIVIDEPDEELNDIADIIEKGGAKAAAAWLKANAKAMRKPSKQEMEPIKVPENGLAENDFFQVLGNVGTMLFAKLCTHQLTSFKREYMMRPDTLLALAPDETWWCRILQTDMLSKAAAVAAGTGLLRHADRKGQIDLTLVTTRGAAQTPQGETIWHLGDKVLAGGEETDLKRNDGLIYVSDPRVDIGTKDTKPLSRDERREVCDLLMRYRWLTEEDGKRMLGWLVSSVCGGALEWRPHLWFLGRSDQGKSWFVKHVQSRIHDTMTTHVGSPTAASVSRLMKSSSLPVVIDEAEPEQSWLEDMIGLCRISAGGEGSRLRADGSSYGITALNPRFSACMLSTRLPRLKAADNNRFVLVNLSPLGIDDWPGLEKDMTAMFDPPSDMGRRIRRTLVHDTPKIAAHAGKLARMLMSNGVSSRRAFIEGALSAGWQWWSGEFHDMVQLENPQTTSSNKGDAYNLLFEILALTIKFQNNTSSSILDTLAHHLHDAQEMRQLKMIGVAKDEDGVLIYPSHPGMNKALQDARSTYAKEDRERLLLQIDSVFKSDNARRFGGLRGRAIVIPYERMSKFGFDVSFFGTPSHDVSEAVEQFDEEIPF